MKTIHVETPCRLHFGLFSFGQSSRRQFGGVGAMFDGPAVKLQFREAATFSVSGPLAERTAGYAARWSQSLGFADPLGCEIKVEDVPPVHVGLGVGTQLGMAVAVGLNRFIGHGDRSAEQLAASVGRGQRSAVGTFGFLRGGLIAEHGKLEGELLAPLMERFPLPADWRVVLIMQQHRRGLHGRPEREAFANLAPVPLDVTEELINEVVDAMLPAVRGRRFDLFCQSVYRYGHLAGECFAEVQGGPYNGDQLQFLVNRLRAIGMQGVGQTSWGPTLFVFTESQGDAESLAAELTAWPELVDAQIMIATPNNEGFRLRED